jgi:hypothetical protein
MGVTRWFRRRQGSAGGRETLFVGRWGDWGPELYQVDRRVRRLAGPDEPEPALAFARAILAEVMRCRPATPLALAYAGAELEPVPIDGFVLSRSEVETWLDGSHGHLGRSRSIGFG